MAIVQPKTRTVRVLRPFMLNGAPTTVGERLTLESTFASEMITAHKAEIDNAPAAPAEKEIERPAVLPYTPPTTKGKHHAR